MNRWVGGYMDICMEKDKQVLIKIPDIFFNIWILFHSQQNHQPESFILLQSSVSTAACGWQVRTRWTNCRCEAKPSFGKLLRLWGPSLLGKIRLVSHFTDQGFLSFEHSGWYYLISPELSYLFSWFSTLPKNVSVSPFRERTGLLFFDKKQLSPLFKSNWLPV